MALSALSRRQDYAEIEKLLSPKKIFGTNKLISPCPWPLFFSLIARYGSPPIEVNITILVVLKTNIYLGS